MQGFTHFLLAILIWKLLGASPLAWILIFLSHFPMDVLAVMTYHTPDPRPQDRFWLGHQILTWVINIILVVIYWELIPVLMVSIIPDIVDWGVLRPLEWKVQLPFETPVFHREILTDPKFLPNLRDSQKGVIPEVLLAAGLGFILFF